MKILSLFQFAYLAFAGLFLYLAYEKYTQGESIVMPLIMAVLAVFMFFFRGHFRKKFQDRNK